MVDTRRVKRVLAAAGAVLALGTVAGCPAEQENGEDQQQEQQENSDQEDQGDNEDEEGGQEDEDGDD